MPVKLNERVHQWAPCRIRVMGASLEEWVLEEADGEWEEVERREESRHDG